MKIKSTSKCWRCNGSGLTSDYEYQVDTCDRCKGEGEIFYTNRQHIINNIQYEMIHLTEEQLKLTLLYIDDLRNLKNIKNK